MSLGRKAGTGSEKMSDVSGRERWGQHPPSRDEFNTETTSEGGAGSQGRE